MTKNELVDGIKSLLECVNDCSKVPTLHSVTALSIYYWSLFLGLLIWRQLLSIAILCVFLASSLLSPGLTG